MAAEGNNNLVAAFARARGSIQHAVPNPRSGERGYDCAPICGELY
jgi:hypothetical protein